MSHVMNTYARQPVAFVRGQGVWLWDEAGRKYLDALAGIAVNIAPLLGPGLQLPAKREPRRHVTGAYYPFPESPATIPKSAVLRPPFCIYKGATP